MREIKSMAAEWAMTAVVLVVLLLAGATQLAHGQAGGAGGAGGADGGQVSSLAPTPPEGDSPNPATLVGQVLDPHASRLLRILSAVFVLVLLLRKYGASLFPVLESRRAGVAMAFAVAALGAAVEGALSGLSWALVIDAVIAGCGAIGAWTAAKNMATGETRAALDTSVRP